MTRLGALRAFGLGALFTALFLAPAGARADIGASDKAAADALYDQAKKLMASGNFEAACPKLAESERLDPGVGTLLTLGECYDHLGKTASAWSTFREAAALANTRGQKAREKVARSRASAIEPQLSKLEIDVPASSEVTGITVLRDQEPVGKPIWGTQVPIDPGEHTITVSAPGKKPWSDKVRVERAKALTTVSVPPLAAEQRKTPDPVPPHDEAPGRGRAQRVIGLVAAGLGLSGIGVGIGLGVYATAKHKDAQAHCAPTCAAGGGDVIQADAKRIALGSTIGFIAGGTLLAGGVVLVLTAPSPRPHGGAAISVAPMVSADVRGAMIGGRF